MIEAFLIALILILLLFVFLPTDLMAPVLLTVIISAPFLWVNQAWAAYKQREIKRIPHFNRPDQRDLVRTLLKTGLRGAITGIIFLLLLGLAIFDDPTFFRIAFENSSYWVGGLWMILGFSVCSGLFFLFVIAGTIRSAYRFKRRNVHLARYYQQKND